MEPISTLTAAANTLWSEANADLAFRKFVESEAGELAKKFTESAIARMDNLRKRSWDKMQGKPTAESAITSIEPGSTAESDRLIAYLQVAIEDDPQFADEIWVMAQQINAGKIQDNCSMTQNNDDASTGDQIKDRRRHSVC